MSINDAYFKQYGSGDRSRDSETNEVTIDIQRHSHAASRVYPKFADAIELTTGAGLYEEGVAVEIVPNGAITREWDIHDVFVSVTDTKDVDYIITIYANDNNRNLAEAVVRLSSAVSAINVSYGKSSPISASIGVYAKAAVQGGGSKKISIRIQYDETGDA
jgi:hypothetical protein